MGGGDSTYFSYEITKLDNIGVVGVWYRNITRYLTCNVYCVLF